MDHSDISSPGDGHSKDSVTNPGMAATSTWKSVYPLASDPRWQLAQRIVASRSFGKSALLSRFLLYVCEREITGRTNEISEHQIGVHVFGRRPGYNAGDDNIVRNYARQLRQRLDHYFQEEGKDEELRISIPRGTYVPTFASERASEWPLVLPPELETESNEVLEPLALPHRVPAISPPARNSRWSPLYTAAALLLGCVAIAWVIVSRAPSPDPLQQMWAQLFDKKHQTLVVPADDGIVMIQNLTDHLIPLSAYINRDYLSFKNAFNIDEQNMKDLDAQRYTSVTDLNAALRLSELPEASSGHLLVRYARELRMEDLKDANVVLLGSSFSNPWVELFQKNLNFEFNYQPHPNSSRILNKHPQSGELATYENDATGPSHRTYAVIALVPNLNNTGWVLIIEGLTMAGTQAAVDTLFNGNMMRPVLANFWNADGSLNPCEILIETRSFGSDAPQAGVLATRVYKKK